MHHLWKQWQEETNLPCESRAKATRAKVINDLGEALLAELNKERFTPAVPVEALIMQAVYLKSLEAKARKRAGVLLKLHTIAVKGYLDLEAQRLRIERKLTKVTVLGAKQGNPKQFIGKPELLEQWSELSAEELDERIAMLEELEEE